MTSAPLLRAFWVQPFLRYFEDLGAPIGLRVWESAAAEPGEASDLPCPSRFVYFLIDRSVEAIDRPCGCEIGQAVGARSGIRAQGGFGRHVLSEPTLGDAIRTAVRLMPSVHGARTLELSCRGGRALLSSRLNEAWLTPTPWEDGFVASILIDLVKSAAGADWHPEAVSLQAGREKHRGCRGDFDGRETRFGAGATTIEFPVALLGRRLAPGLEQQPPGAAPALLPEDFLGCAQLTLEFLMRQETADVDNLSALIGTSRRTLQRRLLRRGETFSGILEQARRDMARRLLEDRSLKVIDVASQVGYSDPSHFARAFRRWTGSTPSAYRGARVSDQLRACDPECFHP